MTRLFLILNWIMGEYTVFGGYIAARIAKHDELTNGTLASFLCVLFALLAIGSTSILWIIIGVVVNPILGFLGGCLRARAESANKMTPNQQPDVRCILENRKAQDTPENRLRGQEKEKEMKSYQIGTLVLMAIILGLFIFISYR